MEKTLGIIGGMGPLATALFYKLVAQVTPGECDQDHFRTLIYSNSKIPKRVEYLLGESDESPVEEIVRTAEVLEKAGATVLAMPCVTAHAFFDQITEIIKTPFINIVTETVKALKAENISSVGILASNGTLKSGYLEKELMKQGIKVLIPDEQSQNIVSRVIYEEIKQNKKVTRNDLLQVGESLQKKGAELILIGCTDLSAYNQESPLGEKYIDMLEILAKAVVSKCTEE